MRIPRTDLYTHSKFPSGTCRSLHKNKETDVYYCFENNLGHGEYKRYNESKLLIHHEFYDNGILCRDFIVQPFETEEERLLFTLKYSGKWLPDE